MHQIAIVNRSTVLTDAAVDQIVGALQVQLDRDFCPVWGSLGRQLLFVPSTSAPPPHLWWLTVLDTSDQANALGYHDVTPTGLPLGKVFAKTTLDDGAEPSVTASHELLEMLCDPQIALSFEVGSRLYAYENCDPVEADEFGYDIAGIQVSDFVTPAWFHPGSAGPYDFHGHLNKPLALLPGGYMQCLDLGGNAGWRQITDETRPAAAKARAPIGSRRERRRIGRDAWIASHARTLEAPQ